MKKCVLIVDSNPLLAKGLQDLLSQCEHFQSDFAPSIAIATEMMQKQRYDVRIVDEDLLNETTGSFWEEFSPGIILTNQEPERLDSCNDMIDDIYLTKPFKFSDLLKCLESISSNNKWQLGPWYFQEGHHCVLAEGRRESLTVKESEILTYLCRANGNIVYREHLLRDIWGYKCDIDTHTLETHIYRLRCKIEPYLDKPQILVTEKNGYRLDNLSPSYQDSVRR